MDLFEKIEEPRTIGEWTTMLVQIARRIELQSIEDEEKGLVTIAEAKDKLAKGIINALP